MTQFLVLPRDPHPNSNQYNVTPHHSSSNIILISINETRCEKSSPLTSSLTAYPNSKFSAAAGEDLTESVNFPTSSNDAPPETQFKKTKFLDENLQHKSYNSGICTINIVTIEILIFFYLIVYISKRVKNKHNKNFFNVAIFLIYN